MKIVLDSTGTLDGFNQAVNEAAAHPGTRTLIVFSCDANGFTPRRLNPILKSIPVPIIGGVFPAICHNTVKLERGTIAMALPCRTDLICVDRLSASAGNFVKEIDRQIGRLPELATIFILADAFANRIDELINALFMVFGLQYNYIGGGAGALSMRSKPCIITNQGLKMDAAIIGILNSASSVGVSHGWRSILGPYRITEAQGNVIKSINWRPAYNLYSEQLTRYGQIQISRNNFYSIAKGYPFGVAKIEAERVIRAPVSVTPEGYLVCVGELSEGSIVDILHGDKQDILAATHKAKTMCADQRPNQFKRPVTILLDCISRVLFLGPHFQKALEAAGTNGQPLVGACTIGEIANTGTEYIEFYNKTVVISVLEGAA